MAMSVTMAAASIADALAHEGAVPLDGTPLRDGQFALTTRLRQASPIRRGDLVVVKSAELARPVVKRVIGLPGESVTIESGRVFVDGDVLGEP